MIKEKPLNTTYINMYNHNVNIKQGKNKIHVHVLQVDLGEWHCIDVYNFINTCMTYTQCKLVTDNARYYKNQQLKN